MNLKRLTVIAVAMSCFFAAQSANATFFTGTATVDTNTVPAIGGSAAPTANVQVINETTGELYTNQLQAGAPALGDDIRTVGMAVIASYTLNPSGTANPVQGVGNDTKFMLVAFAIQGKISSIDPVTGTTVTTFTKGGFGIWEENPPKAPPTATSFDIHNPSTWFVSTQVPNPATLANLTASAGYLAGLAAPDTVLPGAGGANVTFPAATMNQSAANFNNAGQQQGRFLFNTTTDPTAFETANGTQNKFITSPGIFSVSSQVLDLVAGIPTATDLKGGANSQTVLNVLSNLFLGTDFATSFGGADTGTNWSPGAGRGDFSAALTVNSYPEGTIPEPSSVVLLATGTILAGLYARRRKNAK
jgi:hypothetical protein